MEHWVKEEAFIPGLPEFDALYLYRTMDFLLETEEPIQREVFFQVANLFNHRLRGHPRGIPVRCWSWPGNTSDQEIIKTVKKDLNSWKLGRVVMVQDTGFNSEANKRIFLSP